MAVEELDETEVAEGQGYTERVPVSSRYPEILLVVGARARILAVRIVVQPRLFNTSAERWAFPRSLQRARASSSSSQPRGASVSATAVPK